MLKNIYTVFNCYTGTIYIHTRFKTLAKLFTWFNGHDGTDWDLRENVYFEETEVLEVGKTLSTEQFEEGQLLDVTGVSKGKGFAGTVKRWNFKMQDATHGNSISHRAPGSIGQFQTPGRVWKGKKMSGHMGFEKVTTQNLKLVSIDAENNLLLIKGAVPGPTGSKVIIKPSIK